MSQGQERRLKTEPEGTKNRKNLECLQQTKILIVSRSDLTKIKGGTDTLLNLESIQQHKNSKSVTKWSYCTITPGMFRQAYISTGDSVKYRFYTATQYSQPGYVGSTPAVSL